MVRFGPWSTMLGLGMGFGILVACLLWRSRENRTANRLLAAAIGVLVLMLAPYMLGFAGFYDAYPWLSFAPVSFGLALGPLLYLHVVRLTTGRLPRLWMLHLLPGVLQGLYYAVLFIQPQSRKDWWAEAYDGPWVDPVETLLKLVSLSIYMLLSVRAYRAYQAWLDAHLSNREEFRLPWLRNVVYLLAAVVPCWAAFDLLALSRGFDYFQRFPLYLALAAWVVYLGLEGWRHAGRVYPVPVAGGDPMADPATSSLRGPDRRTPDGPPAADDPARWRALGLRWQAELDSAGWWRDPDLDLSGLARRLGTNTTYLSRAFNEGLGSSFHDVVNRLRVDAVKSALAAGPAPGELLDLAFAVGFRSKSSFNRQFKRLAGLTPSQFRVGHAGDVPTGKSSPPFADSGRAPADRDAG